MILGSIPQGEVLIANSTVSGSADALTTYIEQWSEASWGEQIVYPFFHTEWLGSLFDIMVLDLPLFGDDDSPLQIVRWIVLGPIIVTVVAGVVMWFISMLRRSV